MSGKMGSETIVLRKVIREIETELELEFKHLRYLRSRKACIEHLIFLVNKKEQKFDIFRFFKKLNWF